MTDDLLAEPIEESTENTDTETETPVDDNTDNVNSDVDTVDTESDIPTKFINDDGTTNVEALAKSYKELEKGPAVPEVYEDSNFEELGISWGEGEESIKWKEEVHSELREAKLSQKQFDLIMPLYSKAISELSGQFGPPIDTEFEGRKLAEKWGTPDSDTYKQNQHQAGEYIRGLNQPELFKYPLTQTAAGMQLLAELAKSKVGPKFVESNSIVGSADLKSDLADLINDPAYGSGSAKGKLLEQKAGILSQKIANAASKE